MKLLNELKKSITGLILKIPQKFIKAFEIWQKTTDDQGI